MTTAPEYIAINDFSENAREHPAPGMRPADTPPPAAAGTDPEAPWGRRADGTPKAKPGRPKGTPNTSPRRPATPRAAQQRPKAPSGGGGSSKRREPDYRGGINGILQLLAAPLVVAGAKSDAALADAAALTIHGPAIADALHQMALERPEIAAVLDRVLSVGPYGALLAAALPLAVQIAVNHQVIPDMVGAGMGAHPRDDLVAMMRAEHGPQAA